MITLGINGWIDRTHDPAAALIIDGGVVAFVEQERFSRRKHGVGETPHQAVASVLNMAGVVADEVDTIAYGWDLTAFNALRARPVDLSSHTILSRLTGCTFRRRPKLVWVAHHDAHAASAFYGSGFADAAVLVVDAEGETGSSSIYRAAGSKLTLLRRYGRGASLGLMYRALSEYCGFGAFGAGKAMGLAAFGTPNPGVIPLRFVDGEFDTPFDDDADEDDIVAGWLRVLGERFGHPGIRSVQNHYAPPQAHRPDAAASVQVALERILAGLASYAVRLAGSRYLCMAGGVALNCVANGLIIDHVDGFHVPPATHDAGAALGAGLHAIAASDNVLPTDTRADLGPSYTTDEVASICAAHGYRSTLVDSPAATAAELIIHGKTVGWFQGGMEVGPRALGHRSLLSMPFPASRHADVNLKKGREAWRPLALSLCKEEAKRLFGAEADSPFMLISRRLTADGAAAAPACRHVDGSARYQTVPPSAASPFRELLQNLRDATGSGVLLNTSFNRRGEPIVNTPQEALECWEGLGIDALVAEHVLVTR